MICCDQQESHAKKAFSRSCAEPQSYRLLLCTKTRHRRQWSLSAPVHFTPAYRQIFCLQPLPDLQADPERERASLPCACRSAAALLQTLKDGSASASYRASGSHALHDLGCRAAELAIHLTPASTRRSAAAVPPCGGTGRALPSARTGSLARPPCPRRGRRSCPPPPRCACGGR